MAYFSESWLEEIQAQDGYRVIDDGRGNNESTPLLLMPNGFEALSEGDKPAKPRLQMLDGSTVEIPRYANQKEFIKAIKLKSSQVTFSSEQVEQEAVIRWARARMGEWPELRWLHSSLNGVPLKHPKTQRDAKAGGMVEGVCDLLLPCARGPYSGLYLEMKTKSASGWGSIRGKQKEYLWHAHRNRFQCWIPYGRVAACAAILEYLTLPRNELY